jgi:UDP:flavonoid glycosyltransferase YjiC (YdhE family)
MKILFFPSDRGGGFGHISRCFAVAQEAKARGHSCAFVLSDTKYEAKIGSWFPVFMMRQQAPWSTRLLGILADILRPKGKSIPLYICISGLDYQIIRDGLVSEQSIENVLKGYRSAVETFKPEVLVGDTNFLVWMLSREVGVPVVQIVRYASHPMTAKLIWWENIPRGIVPPDTPALFNPILKNTGLQLIDKVEDLFRGDLYIIPSIPEIEPIYGDARTEYVGGLLVSANTKTTGPWSEWLDDSTSVIYVTVGGGAGPVGNKLFFSSIIEAFADYPARIIISTGGKFKVDDLSVIPSNIRFFDWVPGRQIISRANLVIFHGGYATMMETIAAGKPTMVTPFHSEQEGNGRRLEQVGCGHVLKLSNEPFHRIDTEWPFGKYSYVVQRRYDLTSDQLRSTAHEILENTEYSVNTQALQKKVLGYGGSLRAMELIENSFGIRS